MLLTITNKSRQASNLGYLLHKHPGKVQTFDLSFGQAQVFYPEAGDDRCIACLMLDIDPIGLVRKRRGPAGEGRSLEQYVNDRPYVASSFKQEEALESSEGHGQHEHGRRRGAD